MKTKALILVLAAIVLSAGIAYNLANGRAAKAVVEKHDEHEEGVKIDGIETVSAVAGEGWDSVDLTGKVTVPPDRLVKISPRIEGKIVAAYATVGDTVRRGQTLAVISSVELAEARAAYRQASARLQAAQDTSEREQRMVKLDGVAARPLEEARLASLEAKSDLAASKSEVSEAKSELAKSEAEVTRCSARLERARELYAGKIVSRQDLETAEAEAKTASSAVDAAKSKIEKAEAALEKARARADVEKQYLAREEKVYKGRGLDLRTLQSVRAELANARIETQAAADRLRALGANPAGSGDTLAVVSPISGRVVTRNANVGEMASPADSLFTVANLSQVWVEADVYEKDLAKVRKGQVAEIRVDGYPDRVFTSRIDSIGDILSPESRTAKVRCVVSNSHGLLRGEMFAKMSLVIGKRGSTVLVPKQAVLDEAGKKIVFVVCRECAEPDYEKTEVTTGPAHGDKIEVLSGLEPGTEVVTAGAYQLKTALGSEQLKAGCKDDDGCEN